MEKKEHLRWLQKNFRRVPRLRVYALKAGADAEDAEAKDTKAGGEETARHAEGAEKAAMC